MSKIEWTASNNSTYLQGTREAKTIIGAVRAAIKYANGELAGEGKITIYEAGQPVREYQAGLTAGTPKMKWIRTA
jgi:hypothetical protein